MSVGVAQVKLRDAYKELKLAWEHVGSEWDDAARDQFFRDVIEPLETKVRAAMGAMNRLSEAIISAHRECEPSAW